MGAKRIGLKAIACPMPLSGRPPPTWNVNGSSPNNLPGPGQKSKPNAERCITRLKIDFTTRSLRSNVGLH